MKCQRCGSDCCRGQNCTIQPAYSLTTNPKTIGEKLVYAEAYSRAVDIMFDLFPAQGDESCQIVSERWDKIARRIAPIIAEIARLRQALEVKESLNAALRMREAVLHAQYTKLADPVVDANNDKEPGEYA